MHSLEQAKSLASNGLFADALRTLEGIPLTRETRTFATVFRGELLERTGEYRKARESIEPVIRSHNVAPEYRCVCDFVLGRIAAEEGNFATAGAHLQRSIGTAIQIKDFERAAWSQMRLLIVLFDASGSEAVGPLLSDLRANAVRSGNAHVLAAVHLHLAEMESKRGALGSADRHIRIALKTIEALPNVWLQAMAEERLAALACLRLNFSEGLEHANRAIQLAEKAGWAIGCSASTAIFGNLLYYAGRLEEAAVCCERALSRFVYGSDNYSGTLETLARIRLSQGRLDECDELLGRIEKCLSSDDARSRFVYRHSLLTRARALYQRNHYDESSAVLEQATALATKTNDEMLGGAAQLLRAQILSETVEAPAILSAYYTLSRQISLQPPDRHAAYEYALACGLAATGDASSARAHIARAKLIYESVEHRLGLLELATCPIVSSVRARSDEIGTELPRSVGSTPEHEILQTVASILNHIGRSRLIAKELLVLMEVTRCIESGSAVSRNRAGVEEVFASVVSESADSTSIAEIRLSIGRENDCSIDVVVRPTPAIDAFATLNAIARVLTSLQELNRARTDREERATIWPAEELPTDGDQSIISGHMRETMTLAQKVARTTVNVLITGDSGTGKEIVARAIHNYSARAQKPFVPFNCAAIPRDLVESQLFGHRRGAFTGADRDYAGMIRAANGGTLFLDEIGELSADLQPKLLRFLESGEISPLGEASPLHVNVRIVAATNSNLEDAVRDGKFREDLFYRLNVVRLSLRPLRERRDEIPGLVNQFVARAAKEYNKGHLEIAEETMERLLLYRWPGNVRQLQNELRRIVALAEPNSTIEPSAISDEILQAMPIFRTDPIPGKEMAVRLNDKLLPTLSRIECEMIKAALRDNHGRVDAVARALGISRKGLYLKRQRLGL